MEERTFPRGGGEPSSSKSDSRGEKSSGAGRGPRRNHIVFSDTENVAGDDSTSNIRSYESNLFTKLKKQKISTEKRKADIKERKKTKSRPEQLVREEDKIVEHLTYTTSTPGMMLLGRIKEFLGSEVLVSLPGGLRGFVNAFDVSEPFSKRLRNLDETNKSEEEEVKKLLQLFPPGKMVICKVKDVAKDASHSTRAKDRVTVHLTLNPTEINADLSTHLFNGVVLPASVSSVEDHGYVMDIGLGTQGIQAFLPKDKAVLEGEVGAPVLEEGQLLVCTVESGGLSQKNTNVRAVQLSRNLAGVEFLDKKISPANLMPGAIVDVLVTSVTEYGLRVECGSVRGFVSRFHLITPNDSLENHQEKERIAARVLYVNPVTKQTAFSLKTSLWNTQTWNQVSHGDLYEGLVVEDATVLSVVENVGVYLSLKSGQVAFAPRKNLGGAPTEPIKKAFKVGSTHSCVVVGFNDVDEIVLVSLKASLVNQPFLSYNHLHVGQVLDCKVVALVPSGLVVLVGERIQGFVPSFHLSEVPLKNWEKKFSDGKVLTCRVMELDPERKSLVLTHKKSLVDSKDSILQSFDDAEPGKIFVGVIAKIKEQGMLVRFFQQVRGWVPAAEFVEGISLENLYYEGQTVRCKVLRCDKKTQNLQLSLRVVKAEIDSAQLRTTDTTSSIATICQCRITKISARGLEVHIIPSNAAGFIPLTHLTDRAADSADLLKTVLPGQVLDQAVIIKMTPLILSIKPSYIEAASHNDIPTTFVEVHVGRDMVATVTKEKNYGVFVEIANGLGGLLPKRLSGLEPEEDLRVGDSLLVKTEEVDEEKQRLLFRLVNRIGHVKSEPVEIKVKAPRIMDDRKPVVDVGKHTFGDIVSAKVLRVEKAGLKMRTTAKMTGYVRQAELGDTKDSKKSSLDSYHSGQILVVRVIGQHNVPVKTGKGRRVLTKKVKSKPPMYEFSIRHSVMQAKSLDDLRKLVNVTAAGDKKTKSYREIKVEPDEDFRGVAESLTPSAPFRSKKTARSSSDLSSSTTSLLPHLSLSGFSWDETEDVSDSSQPTVPAEQTGQAQKRQRTGLLNERQIYERERQGNHTEDDTKTADDFDRLVLAQGDDSMVWIRYMAFHLQHEEVDKARAVAQRAIKNISFRNDTDRFNVWIALLNLENLHGTKESLDDTFHNAVQHNDPLKIYRQMAAILANTGKHEQAEAIYSKMTGRFKTAKEVWMDYGGYLMANKKHDAAHRLMQRSLQALDQKSQVDVIVKFALLELQHGSRERAKTMFESLLVNYPKRTDLIHVYLGQMIKAEEPPASIRHLFEKIIAMKMPAKKMKTFFKRYLEYEEEKGNAATVEHVKAEAKRFVEQNSE